MAPSKDDTATAGATDQKEALAITILCHWICSAEDFKSDMGVVAERIGLSDKKNVPRKLNSIVNKHGFEVKAGRLVEIGSIQGSAGIAAEVDTGAKTNKAPKKTSNKKGDGSAKNGKKRKTEEAELDDREEAEDDAGEMD